MKQNSHQVPEVLFLQLEMGTMKYTLWRMIAVCLAFGVSSLALACSDKSDTKEEPCLYSPGDTSTYIKCNEVCINKLTNTSNCGSCGTACQQNQICNNGSCLSCPPDTKVCNYSCVNIKVDSNNCGSCGHACASGEVCSSGTCNLTCGGGTTKCGATDGQGHGTGGYVCTNTKMDPANCGNCSNVCTNGQVCSNSQCALSCGGGTTLCGNKCVDTMADVDNCGSCGNGCWGGYGISACVEGSCMQIACPNGLTDCKPIFGCEDTQWDPSHCGSCGHVCASGEACSAGVCGIICGGGATNCGAKCVDTSLDPANCGTCGHACANGEVCSAGSCGLKCVGGTTLCGTKCADTAVDITNCGSCGHACSQGYLCVNGSCISNCPSGTTSCSGLCVNASIDNNNCGSCGYVCNSATQTCSAGICACTGGLTKCGLTCKNLNTDNTNCGSCYHACSTGQTCVSGTCSCPSGQSLCSGGCKDTSNDSANCGSCGNACATDGLCTAGLCHGSYSICMAKQNLPVFQCLSGYCHDWLDGQSTNTLNSSAGNDVAGCLGKPLVAPSIMWIYFDFFASSSSCGALPTFTVWVGSQPYTFTFPQACGSSNSFFSISIPGGTTWNDISFVLYSGDWGSSVRITSITFQ